MIPDRAVLLTDIPEGPCAELTAIDGPPGVGKTTELVELLARYPAAGCSTFSNAAADEARGRLAGGEERFIGTVYKLAWPGVRKVDPCRPQKMLRKEWRERPIYGPADPELAVYERTAPGRVNQSIALAELRMARVLMGWPGPPADPPMDFRSLPPRMPFRYIRSLALWLQAGCPWPKTVPPPPAHLYLDEAQDLAPLEIAGCLGLARRGAEARGEAPTVVAFMDPGQAIFSKATLLGGVAASWDMASEHWRLQGGFRVGEPAASLASSVLARIFPRPASAFSTKGETAVEVWDGALPTGGDCLVLGRNREMVAAAHRECGQPCPIVSKLRNSKSRSSSVIGSTSFGSPQDITLIAPTRTKKSSTVCL